MKVALVYDRVNKWGGAERVLLSLHSLFPNAPLYTSVYDKDSAPWAGVFPNVYTSYLQKIIYAQRHHEHFPFLMPSVFETFNFSPYDVVISVTSEAAKGIITSSNTKHICYCLTPTRYLWSGYKDYFRSDWSKMLVSPVVSYLRKWDKVSAHRPDKMLAISTVVKKRIKKYYKRTSDVVYPPVAIEKFKSNKNVKKDNYFLLVSRLVPYKKVDLAIETFNKLKYPLIIIGSGSEEGSLKAISSKHITFISGLTDKQLADYYRRAQALIFPQVEDFGLVAVEAQAAGTPVIAFKKGGALDIVNSNTGVFFDKQTPEGLKYAIKQFKQIKFNQKDLLENAIKFSEENFRNKFLRTVNI